MTYPSELDEAIQHHEDRIPSCLHILEKLQLREYSGNIVSIFVFLIEPRPFVSIFNDSLKERFALVGSSQETHKLPSTHEGIAFDAVIQGGGGP